MAMDRTIPNQGHPMQVNLDSDIHSYGIRAYQPGAIAITRPRPVEGEASDSSGPVAVETIAGSFILSPRHLIRDWAPASIEELLAEHLRAMLELQPELILLGTGPRLQFPDSGLLAEVYRQQVGVEIMDTAAACRTYNILMTEGRFVVAGLINPVGNED
jgi:uncharacterized protein